MTERVYEVKLKNSLHVLEREQQHMLLGIQENEKLETIVPLDLGRPRVG